jgi:hypothetical protein
MSQVAQDPLEAGREAAMRGAWREAYELLSAAASALPEDLELLAEAEYWTGHLDEATHTRERAYSAFLDAGEEERAALLALLISRDHWGRANLAISQGWFAKAQRLLEGMEESVVHGYLSVVGGLNAAMVGDSTPPSSTSGVRTRSPPAIIYCNTIGTATATSARSPS